MNQKRRRSIDDPTATLYYEAALRSGRSLIANVAILPPLRPGHKDSMPRLTHMQPLDGSSRHQTVLCWQTCSTHASFVQSEFLMVMGGNEGPRLLRPASKFMEAVDRFAEQYKVPLNIQHVELAGDGPPGAVNYEATRAFLFADRSTPDLGEPPPDMTQVDGDP